eukprot:663499-Rhodomonas_salina.1
MSGELNFRMTEKKHELTTWDCKLISFHAHHMADVQKMASSYKMTYTLAAGEALFTKFNEIREEARKASTPFDDDETTGHWMIKSRCSWSTSIKMRMEGSLLTFQLSEEKMQVAMKTAVQDYFIKMNKLLINKWRKAAFPPGKDNGAAL